MQKTALFSLLLFGFCSPALPLRAATDPVLLVANQDDHDLSIIDPATNKQIATVAVSGITGHEVVASADGRTAFVPIYGNSGVGKPGSDGRYMDVIDIAGRKRVGEIDFGHGVRPHCAIYDPVSRMLYITTELDKSVTIIDPRTLKIAGSIPTGQEQSHMLVVSHDGKRGYTANVGPGTVSVLDLAAHETIAVIPVSSTVQRISISNDDRMIFTADQTSPRLAVIDTATDKIRSWIPLPAAGYGTAATSDGRSLLVTIPSLSQVAVVDLKTLKVVQTIDVPAKPTEVLVRPDGRAAYVSCGISHQVAVIDLSPGKVADNVSHLIDAGKGADGLAWSR